MSNNNYSYLPKLYTKDQVDLRNHFRMLWEQHDVWTRSTIVSLVFGLPDTEALWPDYCGTR